MGETSRYRRPTPREAPIVVFDKTAQTGRSTAVFVFVAVLVCVVIGCLFQALRLRTVVVHEVLGYDMLCYAM
eukprot:7494381-Heterocapsa_arctica.AAC.1